MPSLISQLPPTPIVGTIVVNRWYNAKLQEAAMRRARAIDALTPRD